MLNFSNDNSNFIRLTPPEEIKPNIYSFLYPNEPTVISEFRIGLYNYSSTKYTLNAAFSKLSLHGCLVPFDGILFDGNVIFNIKHKRFAHSEFKDLVVPSKYSLCANPQKRCPYNIDNFYKIRKFYVKKDIIEDLLHSYNLYNISNKGLVISEHPFKHVKTNTKTYTCITSKSFAGVSSKMSNLDLEVNNE